MLIATEFHYPKASFLVDPGSGVDLIELKVLQEEIVITPNKLTGMYGITEHAVKTLGTIVVLGVPVEFYAKTGSVMYSQSKLLKR